MPKKKWSFGKPDISPKYISIAVIVVCTLIAGKVMFSDVSKNVSNEDVAEFIGINNIVDNFGDLSKNGKKAAKEISGKNKIEVEDVIEGRFVSVNNDNTYVIKFNNGTKTTIKLIGVDIPESAVLPASNGEKDKAVADVVKEKIHEGDTLWLELGTIPQDNDGKILAYIYFEDGVMVQDWLLENGYAQTLTVPPNTKYSNRFAEIQQKAAENKVGLWNGYFKAEKTTTATAVTTTIQKGEK